MNNKTLIGIVIIIIAIVAIGVYGYNAYVSNSENGTLTIYAASSLSNSMNATAAEFEKKTPKCQSRNKICWK